MKLNLLAISSLIFCLSNSCQKSSTNSSSAGASSNVYVSGFDNDGAAYWKNGVKTPLDKNGIANAIAVLGTDVYVVGDDSLSGAVYWKNGEMITFDNAGLANAITTSGTGIYIAGRNLNGGAYWKNGIESTVASINTLISIAVSGANIYTIDGTSQYWMNSTSIPLDQNYSWITSAIITAGTDVYIAGETDIYCCGSNPYAVYWKNSVQTILEQNAVTTGIAVSGADVYVSGLDSSGYAVYWKDGVKTRLAIGNTVGITVSGTDVYVLGYDTNGIGYWKNGVKTTLPFVVFGDVTGIIVTPN